jgi:E3 ubiquitin-protein ligase TRIP12
MVKGKAKADRLSARQAAAGNAAASNTSIRQPSPASQEIPPVESGSMEPQTQDAEDVLSNDPVKDRVADRTGLLRTKSVVVGRFMHLIVPILVDVYAASVITPVRVKTLTGLLKAVSFLGADSLKHVLEVRGDDQSYDPESMTRKYPVGPNSKLRFLDLVVQRSCYTHNRSSSAR